MSIKQSLSMYHVDRTPVSSEQGRHLIKKVTSGIYQKIVLSIDFRQGNLYFCFHHAFASVHFCVCSLLPCGHLLGKGWPRGSCLWCFIVFLSLSHVVSWVRCGTWLYRFLIFAPFFLRLFRTGFLVWVINVPESILSCADVQPVYTFVVPMLHNLIFTNSDV